MRKTLFLTAAEAAAELGVTVQTLYAYVSRGLVRSEAGDTGKRSRRYAAADIRRLKEQQEMRRDPKKAADGALDWGVPIRDSALTLIDGGRCWYRGRDVLDMAAGSTVEQTAAWFWLEDETAAEDLFAESSYGLPTRLEAASGLLDSVTVMERFQAALPLAAADDLQAYDFRPRHVAGTGARILRMMTGLAIRPRNGQASVSLPETLRMGWKLDSPAAASLLRAALVLCADHELNVSSFTARCVASAGSSPYAVVGAGLAALQGIKHGGSSERVEAMFRETGTPDRAGRVLAERIRRGDSVPGFGHPLYPEGDPRGRFLLDRVSAALPDAPGTRLAMDLAAGARTMLHEEPNIDFALCALSAALDLPPGTPLTLFALGRAIGWVGHAIEEYQTDSLIRPRARYTGRLPGFLNEGFGAGK